MSEKKQSAFEAIASERAVIGAILRGDVELSAVDLAREDFRDVVCGELFRAMGVLSAQGKPCDLVTVSDYLPDMDPGALVDLMKDGMLSAVECGRYVDNIKSASMRRAMCKVARNAAELAGNASLDPVQAVGEIRGQLDELARRGPSRESVSVASMVYDMNMWLFDEQRADDSIRTGISALDGVLGGGIRGKKLLVIGARPSVGKSALGLFFAMNAARDGKRVLIVSLEMDEREIFIRMLSRLSGVPGDAIERRAFTEAQMERIVNAYTDIAALGITINTRATTPAQIRAEAMRLRQEGGLDLIVVDYIQLLTSGQRTSNRTEEVGQISRQLKLMTMELGIPVVALTQMNRQSEVGTGEGGRMPRISESRESGSIEQDANQFLILHQPGREGLSEKYQTQYDTCKAHGWIFMLISVAKNRGGRKGILPVAFDASGMRFIPFTRD